MNDYPSLETIYWNNVSWAKMTMMTEDFLALIGGRIMNPYFEISSPRDMAAAEMWNCHRPCPDANLVQINCYDRFDKSGPNYEWMCENVGPPADHLWQMREFSPYGFHINRKVVITDYGYATKYQWLLSVRPDNEIIVRLRFGLTE